MCAAMANCPRAAEPKTQIACHAMPASFRAFGRIVVAKALNGLREEHRRAHSHVVGPRDEIGR
jgi:hypothetical protein